MGNEKAMEEKKQEMDAKKAERKAKEEACHAAIHAMYRAKCAPHSGTTPDTTKSDVCSKFDNEEVFDGQTEWRRWMDDLSEQLLRTTNEFLVFTTDGREAVRKFLK